MDDGATPIPSHPHLSALMCSYRDDMLYWDMRNPANTVAMTTQPEDNCFTAYSITPPTTLVPQKYVVCLLLSITGVSGFSSQLGFFITHHHDLTSFESASFPPHQK